MVLGREIDICRETPICTCQEEGTLLCCSPVMGATRVLPSAAGTTRPGSAELFLRESAALPCLLGGALPEKAALPCLLGGMLPEKAALPCLLGGTLPEKAALPCLLVDALPEGGPAPSSTPLRE